MEVKKTLPPSVFNIQHGSMVKFLEDQYHKHQSGEETLLYPHQVEAVLRLREYFDPEVQNGPNASNIALVVLPTGCGKTGVAVLASYALDASCVLVITPSIIISKQIDEAFEKFLIDHEVIDHQQDPRYFVPSKCPIMKTSEIRNCMQLMLMIVNAHKIGGRSSVSIEDIPNDHFDLVIVDEAHHYPAPTWKLLVDHFCNSRRLFLTATPEHRGNPILPGILPCYTLSRRDAVTRGVIRDVEFDDETDELCLIEEELHKEIARKMEWYLDQHDIADPSVKHQGMVLAQTKEGINPAYSFCNTYNGLPRNNSHEPFQILCAVYVCETSRYILEAFVKGEIRVLVIIGRLLEGFDHKPVSVVGIVRNVGQKSRVLFAQFVGRAVRKINSVDPVSAWIVTHPCFNQHQNFETFEQLAEEDPTDDDN